MIMWRGSYAFETDKNRNVMITALEHYKSRLTGVSNDKQLEDLPKAVKILLQNEANTPIQTINTVIEILKSNEYGRISTLEHSVSLLENSLKIYKTDLITVSETIASKYPRLFGHKESPNITEEIEIIDKVLEEIKT